MKLKHPSCEIISSHTIVKSGESYDLQVIGHDDKPLTFYDADSFNEKLSKRYKGLYDIFRDVEEAEEAVLELIALKKDSSGLVRRALLSHAIILYGRCFSEADGRLVKLDASKPWIVEEGDEKKRHKELIDFRNQLFAHAGEHYLYKVDCLVVVDNPQNPQAIQLFPCRFDLQGFGDEDLLDTKNHFNKLKLRIQEKLSEIEQNLGKQCFETIVGVPRREIVF